MSDLNWGVLTSLGSVASVILIVTCVIVVVLVVGLVRRFRSVHQPGMPLAPKITFYGSILYTLLPYDLLPDPIFLDDIGVLIGALIHVGYWAKRVSNSSPDTLAQKRL